MRHLFNRKNTPHIDVCQYVVYSCKCFSPKGRREAYYIMHNLLKLLVLIIVYLVIENNKKD